ncbi:MAG: glycosyltransferase family protein [Candidatus Manganitrophus sp.]|nr:glycosyltransferase family protein [Candidatus Manganitrophus sp.]
MPRAVVVQARNGSSRYPRKMLHPLLGRPAIEWVLERCEKIAIDQRILATSEAKEDDPLAEIAQRRGWQVVRGSVEDVLSRFAKAVRAYRLDAVVRITGDCLLTDPRIVQHALTQFDALKPDYLILTKIIDGFDVEVMSGKAILKADSEAKLPSEREHVGPYLRRSKRFNTVFLPYGEEDLSHIHLSLDYKEDADVLESILKQLEGRDFTYADVADLVKANPSIGRKDKTHRAERGISALFGRGQDRHSSDEREAAPIREESLPIRQGHADHPGGIADLQQVVPPVQRRRRAAFRAGGKGGASDRSRWKPIHRLHDGAGGLSSRVCV